jgi:VanZ family protein
LTEKAIRAEDEKLTEKGFRQMNSNFLQRSAAYALLLVYASLYPLQGWRIPHEDILAWFSFSLPQHISRSDFVVNILAYIPFGWLVARLFSRNTGGFAPLCLACCFGMGLSFTMEFLQAFLPMRVSSVIDLLTNSLGTLIGAMQAIAFRRSASRAGKFRQWRDEHIPPGPLNELGLAVIVCWALSQLAPFAPSFDFGEIKNAIRPLWHTVHAPHSFRVCDAATYCCSIAALGIIAQVTVRERNRSLPVFALFATLVLFAKIFVVGRQLSLEAMAGLVTGLALSAFLMGLARTPRLYAASLLLIAGFAVYELKSGTTHVISVAFNWVPFRSQFGNELNGFGTILESTWPFAALSYLSLLLDQTRQATRAICGTVVVVMSVFALELLQLWIPGRTPDITQVLLAVIGWIGPTLHMQQCRSTSAMKQFKP